MALQLAFSPQPLEDAFNFLESGACRWVLRAGIICSVSNFALLNAGAVPNTDANALVF